MQKLTRFFLGLALIISTPLLGQDTFSIVAVDSVTGEVGSAGASCLDNNDITGGVRIISDVLSGRGAIHTQASYNPANKNSARNRMLDGLSPTEIINWLINNDASGTPEVRQYGIVDFDSLGNPRSAAFTGVDCMDYKSHIVGPNYAIQGNILLGQEILDSMESRFLNTNGSLADKLMAAMQGANVPGADTRCLNEGVSSQSAFLRVSRPWDPIGFNYIDLKVAETPFGAEPIDSLQTLFDAWTPAECLGVIPNDAIVADSNQMAGQNNQSFWVCEGDTLELTGDNNLVFLEKNAILLGDLGTGNQVFVKDSGGLDLNFMIASELYFSSGADLMNVGLGPTFFACDSVVFDYTSAPANGCLDNTSRIDKDEFNHFGWSVYPNPAHEFIQIDFANSVKKAGEISLYDLRGRNVFTQKVEGSENRVRVELDDQLKGIYLLEITVDGKMGVKKWVIE